VKTNIHPIYLFYENHMAEQTAVCRYCHIIYRITTVWRSRQTLTPVTSITASPITTLYLPFLAYIELLRQNTKRFTSRECL